MTIEEQIARHIAEQPEVKRSDMQTLHEQILRASQGCRLWFEDGKNPEGKVVANPTIGYGTYTINYAEGTTKEFFKVGMSANTTGISVYIMGLKDKTYLPKTIGHCIGKATVTGYCIKFKRLSDIDLAVLESAIRHRLANESGCD